MQARHIYSTLFSSKKLILHISFVVNWQQKNWQKKFDTKIQSYNVQNYPYKIEISGFGQTLDAGVRQSKAPLERPFGGLYKLLVYVNLKVDKYNFSRKTLDGDCPLLTCDQKTGVTGLEWWPVSFGAQICQELSTACEGSGRRRASNCQSFDDSPSPCLRSAKTYRCQLDSSWLKTRWSLSCNGRHWSVCCELGDFWFCCHICILYL